MRIKSYLADSIPGAMAQARRELGAEAVLLNTKASKDPGARYEVVFGVADAAPQAEPRPPQPPASVTLNSIRAGLQELYESVSTLSRIEAAGPRTAAAPELKSWREYLAAEDIGRSLADPVLRRAAQCEGGVNGETIFDTLVECVEFSDPLGAKGTAAAIIGPPGCGKTTMVIKLALRYGIQEGRRVRLVAADPHRICAAEPLRSYAEVIGAQFMHISDWPELNQASRQRYSDELILIDTPGFSSKDGELIRNLADYMVRVQGLQRHLLLPATMRTVDLERQAGLYAPCRPATLMFSRLDETECRGNLVSVANATQLPVSYLSTGINVPGDLERAHARHLLGRLLDEPERIASVA